MLPIIFLSAALHALAFWLLIRHMRAEARRGHTPVIGSDRRLTEALHARLKHNAPQSDWLSPTTLRAKIAAWRKREGSAETLLRSSEAGRSARAPLKNSEPRTENSSHVQSTLHHV